MARSILCVSLLAIASVAVYPAAASEDQLQGSARFERNGWIYVRVAGPPARLGYQHGYLLAPEIKALLGVLPPFLAHTTKHNWQFYRDASQRILWPKIDAEFQSEIDGIIATGSYTKDRRVVMGHNNWTNYATGSRWNIIFDIRPQRGNRIIMDGLPGVITSDDDFGVNSAGIMITETTITGFELFDPHGSPEFYRSRKALQYSNSIDDYVRIMLEGNNGGYANDWLIGDNKTGEIAVFELGLKEHSLRRTKDGYFVGSNFPVDPQLARKETNFDAANKQSSPNARRARWEQLMAQNKGKIDVEIAKQMESDTYDIIEKKQQPDERTLCGCVDVSPKGIPEWDWGKYFPGGTVQAKTIDGKMAEAMEFWAAMGHPCGADFMAADFIKQHPEYAWMRGLLQDMPSRPWTK